MNRVRALAFFLCGAVLLSACAGPQVPPPAEEPPAAELTAEEQDKAAFVLFKDLYEFTGTRSRQDSLPQIIETYETIIRDYPEAGLAQEAYMKLILIHLEEFTPPEAEKAEAYYRRFIEAYPDSVLRNSVEGAFLGHYHKHENWQKLLSLSAKLLQKDLEHPHRGYLYYYAEANLHLNRPEEAALGYRRVIESAPRSPEARYAAKRLQELGEIPSPGSEPR